MSQFVLSNIHETRQSGAGTNLYDLAAVIVHHGSGYVFMLQPDLKKKKSFPSPRKINKNDEGILNHSPNKSKLGFGFFRIV